MRKSYKSIVTKQTNNKTITQFQIVCGPRFYSQIASNGWDILAMRLVTYLWNSVPLVGQTHCKFPLVSGQTSSL